MVNVQSSPGNWNVNPYMHGMANGLILALHTARDDEGEVAYLPAPAKWTDDAYNVPTEAPEPDADLVEDMLIGLWIGEQRDAGNTAVNLEIVEHIRAGIRLALG